MPFDFSPDYTVPAEDLEAARILREAARYIEEHGWCQHALENEAGEVCALEAIGKVNADRRWYANVRSFAQFVGASTPVWNNAPGRTKDEVITALTGCADWLESGRPDR